MKDKKIYVECPNCGHDISVELVEHDKQIRADMIDKFKKIIRSVSSSGYRDIDGDWVTPSCDTKRLFDALEKIEEQQ